MSSWAKPGVQCVCISDEFGFLGFANGPQIPTRQPMINEVLTVKSVSVMADVVCLTFEEIDEWQEACDDTRRVCGKIYWYASCFRPLIKRPTDISIFRKMLTPAPKEGVPA